MNSLLLGRIACVFNEMDKRCHLAPNLHYAGWPPEAAKGAKKMAVLLLIITFAVFIAIDWVMNHGKAPALSFAEGHAAEGAPADDMVAGFHLPRNLRYHPGHTWVARERKNLNRVGADEFATV